MTTIAKTLEFRGSLLVQKFAGCDPKNLLAAAGMLPGVLLQNRATVVVARVQRNHFIVLAVNDKAEYVTWACSPLDGACFHGHYFDDLGEAVEDYNSR